MTTLAKLDRFNENKIRRRTIAWPEDVVGLIHDLCYAQGVKSHDTLDDYRRRAQVIMERRVEVHSEPLADIAAESEQAIALHGQYASLHEFYSVALEELDEIWEIVRLKRKRRGEYQLRRELTQLAAVALKALRQIERFI